MIFKIKSLKIEVPYYSTCVEPPEWGNGQLFLLIYASADTLTLVPKTWRHFFDSCKKKHHIKASE